MCFAWPSHAEVEINWLLLWAEVDSPAEAVAGYKLGFEAKYPASLCAEAAWSHLHHGLLDTALDVEDNLTQREHGKNQRRPCFAGEEDWNTDLPPKAAALFQTAASREMLCPVCHDFSGEGWHAPHYTVTRVTVHSVMCLPHQTDTIIRKMLPCSVAETDRKLVRIGTSRAGIQK